MKLYSWQKEAAASKVRMNVLRWGHETGKDVLIDYLLGPDDFVIMPGEMAALNAEAWEGRSVFRDSVINENLLHFIKRKQPKHHRTKRIILNECAFMDVSLFELLKLIDAEFPKAQIYLISTPRGGFRLNERGAAGLEFDMMCARLEICKENNLPMLHDWYYSQKAAIAGGPKDYENLTDTQLLQEYLASWWAI